jgi:hypothetical protein
MPERIQQRRTRGWRKPPSAVSVARGTRWGNPYRIEEHGRVQAVALYRAYALNHIGAATIRRELAERDLMCWCALHDKDGNRVLCHADILIDIANGKDDEMNEEKTGTSIYDEPLKWGETYFDRMTHEELLLHAKRMYSALGSTKSVIAMLAVGEGANSFYGKRGAGGAALAEARQALRAITQDRDDYREGMYRAYFRYADDLLFERNDYRLIGMGWRVCEAGHMTGNHHENPEKDCPLCGGSVRDLQWSDLEIRERSDDGNQ